MVKHAALNKKSTSSDNPDRAAKGKGRSKATIQRLNMYRSGHAKRDVNGKVIGGSLMMRNQSGGQNVGSVVRIAPDRRWFGNTRTLSQTELDKFRAEMTTQAADPYSVILKRNKIPMALLNDAKKTASMNLLKAETYDEVFGSKSTRKRPKLSAAASDYSALLESAQQKSLSYESGAASKDRDAAHEGNGNAEGYEMRREDVFSKGQSKRIWAELYKVLDSSDVILQVIDARDVPGTRCYHLENHIKKNAKHKHLVLIINKCDLVPSWVTRKWVKILSKEFPTLAFHASINNAFGKGALISLLRQFAKLHSVIYMTVYCITSVW
jgi:nuclear GTP-binding protein